MKKIIFAAMVLGLAACSSPRPDFFQPVAVKTTETVYTNVKGTVLLGQVLLPAEAARPQITTLGKKNYELKIDEFNRWGAAPERLIQHTLNQDLSLLLPNAIVENQTTLRKNYQYAVVVEINELNGRLNDIAVLKASYFIKNKQNRVIKSGRFDMSVEIDGGYEAYVPAQSRLLALLAADIAKGLSRLKY